MGLAHIKDRASGRFCRHADWRVAPGEFTATEVTNAKPFLEAGASLIDSLCWLARQTGDARLAEMALSAARYSYAQRDAGTGLLRNQPVDQRWDYHASTTEIGLWAGSLIRASEYTENGEFQRIAEAAIRPWLRLGYDSDAGQVLRKAFRGDRTTSTARETSGLDTADVCRSVRHTRTTYPQLPDAYGRNVPQLVRDESGLDLQRSGRTLGDAHPK